MTAVARRERGAVPIELALGVGVLVLPIAVLVAVLPTWAERQATARTAAAEAARAVAVADSYPAGVARARTLAGRIAANRGLGQEVAAVELRGGDADGDGVPDRDGAVTASVTVHVPLTPLPGMSPAGGFAISAAHTEPIDAYRSFP